MNLNFLSGKVAVFLLEPSVARVARMAGAAGVHAARLGSILNYRNLGVLPGTEVVRA